MTSAWRQHRRPMLVVVGVGLVGYVDSLWNGFVWDDTPQIVDNRGEIGSAKQMFLRAATTSRASDARLELARHGETAEARRALTRALELQPNFPQARQVLTELASRPPPR